MATEFLQAPACVLMQVGVPGSDERYPSTVSRPKSQDSQIARSGDVDQVRTKRSKVVSDPVFVAIQQEIASQIIIQWERRQAPFQLDGGQRVLLSGLRPGAAVDAQKGKLLALSKHSKFPAERSDTVGFVKGISE